jgi:hypothetical protein
VFPYASLSYNALIMTLEETLLSVWQQSLIDRSSSVELETQTYAVKRTPSSRLRQIDFLFEGKPLRGLEQNPNTKSRWAQLARSGKRVMQFLEAGRYVAVVAEGKLTLYGPRK